MVVQRRKRQFPHFLTVSMVVIGLVFFFQSLLSATLLTADSQRDREIDIAKLMPGQRKVVWYKGLPVIVRHLTQEELRIVRQNHHRPPLHNTGLPNTITASRPEIVVADIQCVLLDWEPHFVTGAVWFCPLRGAFFDGWGRVIRGGYDGLSAPPWRFVGDDMIMLDVMVHQSTLEDLDARVLGFRGK